MAWSLSIIVTKGRSSFKAHSKNFRTFGSFSTLLRPNAGPADDPRSHAPAPIRRSRVFFAFLPIASCRRRRSAPACLAGPGWPASPTRTPRVGE
eukprot:5481002-Heterocapsa_arctica.AAC.1